MRPGAAYFLQPDSSQQRRYEALRAYFVEDLPASQVADRYGYSDLFGRYAERMLIENQLDAYIAGSTWTP